MDARSTREKKEIACRMKSFPYCGFSSQVTGNISYYKSFVGRDFKAWIQMAPFIICSYLTDSSQKCWILLGQVFPKFI